MRWSRAMFIFALIASTKSVSAADITNLFRLGAKLGRSAEAGRHLSYSARAEKMLTNLSFRTQAMSKLADPGLALQVQQSFHLANLPRYQIAVRSEMKLLKAVEKGTSESVASTAAKNKNALVPDETLEKVHRLFRDVLGDVPLSAFKNKSAFEKSLLEGLKKRVETEAASTAPKFTFEVLSGKLSFPNLGTIGGVKISGGDVNTYKIIASVAGVTMCDLEDCVDKLAELVRAREHQSEDKDMSPAEAEERIRRAALQPEENDPLHEIIRKLPDGLELKL